MRLIMTEHNTFPSSHEPTDYKALPEVAIAQRGRLTSLTWDGARVMELIGTVEEIFPQVPVFSRRPYRVGEEENRFKDEIRREPLRIREESLPIATVSKTYSLVQHREVLSSIFRALKMIRHDISAEPSSLLLSEYGERMQWSCSIPGMDFDPGDHCPLVLQINCLNSVDTTTVLEISFSWYRLVCGNGLMLSMKESQLRRRHIQSLDPDDIAVHLEDQLKEVPAGRSLFEDWYKRPVEPLSLMEWVDGPVAREWGPHVASRIWNILTQGRDGVVEQVRGMRPHHLPIISTTTVPGSCAPVNNLFHVSQALTWIAGTRNTIPERLEYLKTIPGLMSAIL
jgi:hypothetical protein